MKNISLGLKLSLQVALVMLLAAVVMGMVGCASDEQLAAFDGDRCQRYGFTPGTDGYAGCMQRLDQRRTDGSLHEMEKATAIWTK